MQGAKTRRWLNWNTIRREQTHRNASCAPMDNPERVGWEQRPAWHFDYPSLRQTELWWSSAMDGLHPMVQQWQMPSKMTQGNENATHQSSLNPRFPIQLMDAVKQKQLDHEHQTHGTRKQPVNWWRFQSQVSLRLLTPPMETPDPPNDTPGALKQVLLTPHHIPWSLRVVQKCRSLASSTVVLPPYFATPLLCDKDEKNIHNKRLAYCWFYRRNSCTWYFGEHEW